ncbi:DUF805 domain-containing protein [Sphingobacterium sp. E70]|uniref:DUF805 domain-containing protein n=1 Tax=Sphingobacterium sp. E70 TaxID=2853439 RepID=UPI00211C5583|nr:DUF805 domain-containing protein [Sphingobacterium sp. E70]ULT28415.1 DUF805 domain-containing protein [Sphingobacterium sp. E70]
MKVVRDNYANFNGRARRKEYWMFFLANVIIGVVFGILGQIASLFSYISYLVSLALLIPGIAAVGVRRLHDTNKSGWFLLLGLIPLVNLYLIYLMVIEGDKGPNQYGPDPKAEENGASHPFNQAQDPFGSSQPKDPFGSSQAPTSSSTPPPDNDPFA